jgi:predicted pyridoxine 5'-phosphate oxidase superfamily flavin-nucleotide-binding protein
MMSSSSSAVSTQQQFFMVSFLFVSIAAVAFAAAAASSSLELLTLREFGLMLIGAVLSSIVTIIITTLSSSSSSSSSSSKNNYNNINHSSTAAAATANGCNKVTPPDDDVKQKQQQKQQQDKNGGGGDDDDEKQENENDQNIIRSVKELREIMPAGGNGSNLNDSKKVIGYLDDQMIEFISKSPFLQLATIDSKTGKPSVSPKGDQPGFATVVTGKKDEIDGIMKGISLIIPDRPGNRMMLGLQNILNGNKNVSIIFEIPGMCTTLRCGGINARISKDTTLLKNHTARNCTPKVVILIDIEYAFFHCAKAYMRSGIWDPTTWPSSSSSSSSSSRQSGGNNEGECKEFKVGLGRYYAPKDSFLANVIDNDITDHYKGVQDAINGEGKEVER